MLYMEDGREVKLAASGNVIDNITEEEDLTVLSKQSVALGRPDKSTLEAHGGRIHQESDEDTDLEMELQADALHRKKSSVRYDTAGKQAYLGACKMFCQIPASYFLRYSDNEDFKMRHHCLGVGGMKALAVSLVSNTTIEILDLEDNGILDQGCIYLAEMLKENYFITDLNISLNNIGWKGINALFDVVKQSDSLVRLNVSRNPIGDRSAKSISDALTESSKLRYLDLSDCRLGEDTATELGAVLTTNRLMETLDVSSNNFRTNGVLLFLRGVAKNTKLRELDVSKNGVGMEGCLEIGKMLKDNKTLQVLRVSDSRVPLNGTVLIARSIRINNSLRFIYLDDNPFMADGCMVMLELVSKSFTVLRYMSFGNIKVSKQFGELQQATEKDKKILVKHGGVLEDILQNRIDVRVFKSLREAFNFLQTIELDQLKKELEGLCKESERELETGVTIKELGTVLEEKLGWKHRSSEMVRRAKSTISSGKIEFDDL